MGTVIMILQLIAALSILVVLHEFGHFIAARIFGIRVEKFYMFFNPKLSLITYKKGEGLKFFVIHKKEDEKAENQEDNPHTTYGIGWLPLGGYVKISGMIDESMDKEQLKKPPQPYEFRSKPAWQRLIVMIGGVIMNLILGIVVLSFIHFKYTQNFLPVNEVNKNGIYAYEYGRQMGFQTGDKIVAINGKPFERFSEVTSYGVLFGDNITVERDGKEIVIDIPDTLYRALKKMEFPFVSAENYPFHVDSLPEKSLARDAGIKPGDKFIALNGEEIKCIGQFRELLSKNKNKEIKLSVLRNNDTLYKTIQLDSTGLLGFYHNLPDYKMAPYTWGKSFKYGTSDAIEMLIANVKGIGKIFSGKEKASESIAGPIAIATMFGNVWIWERFWRLVGLLSLILAFMNILPIPALDGGHVILTLIEWISGRKIPDKVMEKIQMVGMIILLLLMIYIFGNDIFRLFNK
ncbi:MAG: RIP metalloprotease RseP [Marinilabiliales bacterium]